MTVNRNTSKNILASEVVLTLIDDDHAAEPAKRTVERCSTGTRAASPRCGTTEAQDLSRASGCSAIKPSDDQSATVGAVAAFFEKLMVQRGKIQIWGLRDSHGQRVQGYSRSFVPIELQFMHIRSPHPRKHNFGLYNDAQTEATHRRKKP